MGKPPPSTRQLVPRAGTSDYDEEEATSLDPFALRDDELVAIPRAGTDAVPRAGTDAVPRAGTDAIRDDLRADPDVQDALRWLDPPANAGPPVAAAAAVATATAVVVDPVTGTHQRIYTPLPQSYPGGGPGAGPYPTPVPNFVSNTGPYYLVTPMPPQAAPPPPARSPILWILLTAVVTGGGIALGWWMFAGRSSGRSAAPAAAPARATATPAATQAPPPVTPPQPSVAPPVTPPPATPPAEAPPPEEAAAPTTAEVVGLATSKSVSVAAPVSGEVSKVFVAASGKVAKGDKLIEIRSDIGASPKAKNLAARVAELEKLAKSDPVYEEFLADARKAERAARGKVKLKVVRSPAAGRARLEVKAGDAVSGGAPIGQISSGGDWIVKATAKVEVLRSWTCHLELPDGKRAPCAIDKVVASAAGSDITATVAAADAPWLDDLAQKPTLSLAAP
jgi:biotin carboxyl carrier protein